MEKFAHCELCGANDWASIYKGKVRFGSFGNYTNDEHDVARCSRCGVDRLAESGCCESAVYVSADYRELLGQGKNADDFFAEHDHLQLLNLTVLHPEKIRGRVVADIGCAAGSFLDHVAGVAAETIAIEPCVEYHRSLEERGHRVFSDVPSALDAIGPRVDIAFSFSVIEHVDNPRVFLAEIASLLRPAGKLLVSTPNRADVLMTLLPDDYPSFFYRSVHRWYFDMDSLEFCATEAGLETIDKICVHRFGMANTLAWLRDRRPTGHRTLEPIDGHMLDGVWKSYLEKSGMGDYLFSWLSRGS